MPSYTFNIQSYIPKMLKQVSTECTITHDAKRYLNQLIFHILSIIIHTTIYVNPAETPPTLHTFIYACTFLFRGDLQINCIEHAIHTNETLIPKLVIRKMVHAYHDMRLSDDACLFCCAVIEYISVDILESASIYARYYEHRRIIPRDILLAVQCDDELFWFCKEHRIIFLDAGHITSPLLDRIMDHHKTMYTSPILFEMCVNQMKKRLNVTTSLSTPCMHLLHSYIEHRIVHIVQQAFRLMKRQRVTEHIPEMTANDILAVYELERSSSS